MVAAIITFVTSCKAMSTIVMYCPPHTSTSEIFDCVNSISLFMMFFDTSKKLSSPCNTSPVYRAHTPTFSYNNSHFLS